MTEARHRHTRPADRLVDRLQAIILEGATLVSTVADVGLYETPDRRFFTFDGANLHPVTKGDALAFKGEA